MTLLDYWWNFFVLIIEFTFSELFSFSNTFYSVFFSSSFNCSNICFDEMIDICFDEMTDICLDEMTEIGLLPLLRKLFLDALLVSLTFYSTEFITLDDLLCF